MLHANGAYAVRSGYDRHRRGGAAAGGGKRQPAVDTASGAVARLERPLEGVGGSALRQAEPKAFVGRRAPGTQRELLVGAARAVAETLPAASLDKEGAGLVARRERPALIHARAAPEVDGVAAGWVAEKAERARGPRRGWAPGVRRLEIVGPARAGLIRSERHATMRQRQRQCQRQRQLHRAEGPVASP